jgi:hypothetical protein
MSDITLPTARSAQYVGAGLKKITWMIVATNIILIAWRADTAIKV